MLDRLGKHVAVVDSSGYWSRDRAFQRLNVLVDDMDIGCLAAHFSAELGRVYVSFGDGLQVGLTPGALVTLMGLLSDTLADVAAVNPEAVVPAVVPVAEVRAAA